MSLDLRKLKNPESILTGSKAETKYPESEKIRNNDYGAIMEFIDFLRNEGYEIKKLGNLEEYMNSQDLIYKFFEVDKVKLEKERREMLKDF